MLGPRDGQDLVADLSQAGLSALFHIELDACHGLACLPKHILSLLVREGLLLQQSNRALELAGIESSSGSSFAQWAEEVARVSGRVTGVAKDSNRTIFLGLVHQLEENAAGPLRIACKVVCATSLHGALCQLGGSNAGMGHEGLDLGACLLQALVQSIGESHVGQLCLLVPNEVRTPHDLLAVSTQVSAVLLHVLLFQLVRKLRASHHPCTTRVIYHACLTAQRCRLVKQRHAEIGQKEVGQVVCLHLDIAAVLCCLVSETHDAGVVTQDIESTLSKLRLQLFAGSTHALEAHEVTWDARRLRCARGLCCFADVLQSLRSALRLSVQKNKLGAFLGTNLCKDLAGARSAARDSYHLPSHARQSCHHALEVAIATKQVPHGARRAAGTADFYTWQLATCTEIA
mmetsp:Transcript_83049/g.199316  ORF Transcript_83049/g.199316 Transcript_83049/m.199316 type:complete len:402 (-) Transcript_83049:1-1206(-)